MTTIAYQASATGGFKVTADTPRQAATLFFATFPKKRKCSVIQGELDGDFFVLRFNLCGKRPLSLHDVTKHTAPTLPDTNQGA